MSDARQMPLFPLLYQDPTTFEWVSSTTFGPKRVDLFAPFTFQNFIGPAYIFYGVGGGFEIGNAGMGFLQYSFGPPPGNYRSIVMPQIGGTLWYSVAGFTIDIQTNQAQLNLSTLTSGDIVLSSANDLYINETGQLYIRNLAGVGDNEYHGVNDGGARTFYIYDDLVIGSLAFPRVVTKYGGFNIVLGQNSGNVFSITSQGARTLNGMLNGIYIDLIHNINQNNQIIDGLNVERVEGSALQDFDGGFYGLMVNDNLRFRPTADRQTMHTGWWHRDGILFMANANFDMDHTCRVIDSMVVIQESPGLLKTHRDSVTYEGLHLIFTTLSDNANAQLGTGPSFFLNGEALFDESAGLVRVGRFENTITVRTNGTPDMAGDITLFEVSGIDNNTPNWLAPQTYTGLGADLNSVKVTSANLTLIGLDIYMPTTYGVATEYGARFRGDGRTVYVCTDTYALDVVGDVNFQSSIDMTGGANNWLRPPRMTTAQRNAMTAGWGVADTGKEWYNTDTNRWEAWNGTIWVQGFSITMDDAYDGGGAGTGRRITVDSGPLELDLPATGVGMYIDGATITRTGTDSIVDIDVKTENTSGFKFLDLDFTSIVNSSSKFYGLFETLNFQASGGSWPYFWGVYVENGANYNAVGNSAVKGMEVNLGYTRAFPVGTRFPSWYGLHVRVNDAGCIIPTSPISPQVVTSWVEMRVENMYTDLTQINLYNVIYASQSSGNKGSSIRVALNVQAGVTLNYNPVVLFQAEPTLVTGATINNNLHGFNLYEGNNLDGNILSNYYIYHAESRSASATVVNGNVACFTWTGNISTKNVGGFSAMIYGLITGGALTPRVYGAYYDLNGTIPSGGVWRGEWIDADGVVCSAGQTFYGIDIDMDGMTIGGTIAGIRVTVPSSVKAGEFNGNVEVNGVGNWLQTPKMTTAQENAMVSGWGASEEGRQWYNTDTHEFKGWNGTAVIVLG